MTCTFGNYNGGLKGEQLFATTSTDPSLLNPLYVNVLLIFSFLCFCLLINSISAENDFEGDIYYKTYNKSRLFTIYAYI